MPPTHSCHLKQLSALRITWLVREAQLRHISNLNVACKYGSFYAVSIFAQVPCVTRFQEASITSAVLKKASDHRPREPPRVHWSAFVTCRGSAVIKLSKGRHCLSESPRLGACTTDTVPYKKLALSRLTLQPPPSPSQLTS